MSLYSIDGIAPKLPPAGRYWVAPDAIVIGDVEIGEDVGIWFGTTIRGDNDPIRIGRETNVQELCVFHTDVGFPLTIGARCTIGHRAILHGCTIGANTLIGMGATVLNGARIGDNCLVGAGALVTEGKVIPDNSLVVGMPGKVVRSLTEAEIAGLTASAAHYAANWKRFAKGLVRV
jgi:carbonic anhydrase/acetyltransferase-like protein (isoleucine patch superfamily)